MNSKLPDAGTTIFTVMSRLAQQCGAINLSQGFPDFEGPQRLRDRVSWHMDHGHNQYAPLAGVDALREQIASKIRVSYGLELDPQQQITITPGATEALFCAITAMVHPGDEVILFDPAYDTYAPSVKLNGGVPRHMALTAPGFRIDWQQVRDMLGPRSRMIILNTPHNPTGSALDAEDVQELAALVDEFGLYVLSDEVYEHMLFDGRQHHSVLTHEGLARRSFAVYSFGKVFHATGWRIGYCVAPPNLTREFLRIHQYINFSTNAPMQHGLADFMEEEPEFCASLGSFYQAKRDRFIELLADTDFELRPSAGSFFQLADYRRISELDDVAFAEQLTREYGVAVIPVSVFYRQPPEGQRLVRFCFAKNDATLQAAAERLQRLGRRP